MMQVHKIQGGEALEKRVVELEETQPDKADRIYLRVMVDDEDEEGNEDATFTSVNVAKLEGSEAGAQARFLAGFGQIGSSSKSEIKFNNSSLFLTLKNNWVDVGNSLEPP